MVVVVVLNHGMLAPADKSSKLQFSFVGQGGAMETPET